MGNLEGNIGVYYKDLTTGQSFGINENEQFLAASVIKIPVLAEAFRQEKLGMISFEEMVVINNQVKLPSCGSLTYMHDGLQVSVMDLCVLMIIQSDNTATNLMIKKLGIENINGFIKKLGLEKTHLNRLLFDSKEQKKGKENYITPHEMGLLLEMMWEGKLVSNAGSEEMLEILKKQQINHKIPYFIPNNVKIAHKTGEDSEITNDMALVFAEKPFILCCAANNTNVQETEDFYRKAAKYLFDISQQ
jgi:beta-lactamase class A